MTQSAKACKIEARQTGKGASLNYRKQRKVPAVVYGPKTKNINCLMDEIFVLKHSSTKHESSIFQTTSDDAKLSGLKVMLKKIETHPGTSRPIHVDLYALDMTAKIKVNMTLQFEGEAIGVKEGGGVLQMVLREVEVECDPTSIPENIKVDVSEVQLNESLHVSDLQFPTGVTPVTPATRTICSVSAVKEEPVSEPGAAEPTEITAETETSATPADEKKD